MSIFSKIFKSFLYSALILGGLTSAALAGATQEWVVRYDENTPDERGAAQQVLVDGENNVYMVGEYGDGVLIAKYNTNGQMLWDKRLSGKWLGYGWRSSRSAAIDSDNHLAVAGRDGFIIKLDEVGTTLFEISVSSDLGYPANISVIAADPSGNIYAAGTVSGETSGLDAMIAKYTPDGSLLWQYIYDGSGKDDLVTSLRLAGDGTVYGGGTSSNGLLLFRLDSNGAVLFSITDPEEILGGCMDLDLDSFGNLVTSGWIREGDWSSGAFFVAKFTKTGSRLWVTSEQNWGYVSAVRVDRNDDVYIAGAVNLDGTFYRYLINKYSADGTLLWHRNYYMYGDSDVFALELDKGMEPIITGEYGYCYDYIRTIKFSTEGSIRWDFLYRPGGSGQCGSVNYGLSLALDSKQNVYVGGYSLDFALPGYPYKPTLIKYAQPVTVGIDIKPGAFPNAIKLGTGGSMPVAILSSSEFDATRVDPLSVTVASAPVKLVGKGTIMSYLEDSNFDGLLDMVVHVNTQSLQLSVANTEALLEGRTLDGVMFEGTDSILVIR